MFDNAVNQIRFHDNKKITVIGAYFLTSFPELRGLPENISKIQAQRLN